jgi:terminal uridylyltransferase
MILHYLINVVSPPVLPNLQLQPVSQEDDGKIFYRDGGNEYNIWFSRDTQSILPSVNNGTLGELLRGFFDYYAYKFAWGQDVISIRTKGGLLTKQDKGWITAKSRPGITVDGSETYKVKDRYIPASDLLLTSEGLTRFSAICSLSRTHLRLPTT